MIPTEKTTRPSLNSLVGMRSERTTFRLSKQAQEALGRLRKMPKVTTKTMLDTIADLLQHPNLTDLFVKDAGRRIGSEGQGIRKTWVISKTALTIINSTAKAKGISRDRLVENMIFGFEDMIETSKRPENLKKALELVEDFRSQAEDVHSQLVDLLGDEEPVRQFVDAISTANMVAQGIKKALSQMVPA